jgi:hypothetical protein
VRDNFFRIAERLDVAPALAELAGRPDLWVEVCDTARQIPLLDSNGAPIFRGELPAVWALIDIVRAAAARAIGAGGRLSHARVGLMKPGEGLPPHRDGVDCVRQRRYQIALRSDEGVTVTVAGEALRPMPGDAWQLNVARTHWVANDSTADRITILFDTMADD